jgi:hypothetical protein
MEEPVTQQKNWVRRPTIVEKGGFVAAAMVVRHRAGTSHPASSTRPDTAPAECRSRMTSGILRRPAT